MTKIGIILHFGMGHWNQPKNLKKVVKVPDELDQYVNDYKIHVFEIAWLTDEHAAAERGLAQGMAQELITNIESVRKYSDCTLNEALIILGKNIDDYENAKSILKKQDLYN